MTIHEELQGLLKCDQNTTQNCCESEIKKQQEVKPEKKITTPECPSAKRGEQRGTSTEQSMSETFHLTMVKNGMDCVEHTHTHTHIHKFTLQF